MHKIDKPSDADMHRQAWIQFASAALLRRKESPSWDVEGHVKEVKEYADKMLDLFRQKNALHYFDWVYENDEKRK